MSFDDVVRSALDTLPPHIAAALRNVAVVVEGAALPLVHSAWVTAAAFTVLNAAVLTVRIRAENAALATVPA